MLTDLAPGTYRLTAALTGFATVNSSVTVTAHSSQTTNITLGPLSQTTLRTIGHVVTSRSAIEINRTPAALGTVTQQTYIDRGQTQVSNVLEELPGVELQRFSSGGGPGANTVAALRGADPAETQTLIDGHPVSGGPESDYLIQFLNPLLLDNIEVSKGPGVFGNYIQNQVNGSINYRTPSIAPKMYVQGTVGYDTYNGSTDSLLVSDTIGKFGFLAGYAQFGTPGYNTQPILSVAANGTPALGTIPDATVTTSIPSTQAFENHGEVFKLGYNFSNSTALQLGFLGLYTYADYTGNLTTLEPFHILAFCPNADANGNTGPGTGAGCAPSVHNKYPPSSYTGPPSYTAPAFFPLVGKTVYAASTADNLYLGNFENDSEPFFTADLRTTLGRGSLLARYYAASIARDLSDPEEAFQPTQCTDPACNFALIAQNKDLSGPYYQTQTDYLHGADFQYAYPIGANTYTLSYDDHGDRTTACSGGVANPAYSGACYVPSVSQTSQTFGFRGDLHFGSRFGAEAGGYLSHATFVGGRFDPRIGLTYFPNANVALRLSAGSSFVAPSAQLAYDVIPHVSQGTLYQAVTKVQPETSAGFDVGSDIKTDAVSKLSLDLYATRLFNRFDSVSQQIGGTFGGASYSSIQLAGNDATALEKGIELTFTRAPGVGFGTTEYLDFMRAFAGGTNTASGVFQGGTIYGNTADGIQFAGYPWTHGRAELNYTTQSGIRSAFGATYYGLNNSFNEPAFALFDANVSLPLKHGLVAHVAVNNIFNHDDYRTFGIYNYGYAPLGPNGNVYQQTLYFAPPREFTFELTRTVGNP